MHQKRGAVTNQELNFYTKAAESDYEGTKKVLEGKKGTDGLEKFVKDLSNGKIADADNKSKWTYADWYKKDLDGLQKMEAENPEGHKTLLDAYRLSMRKDGTYVPTEQ